MNALHSHAAEFGVVAAKGLGRIDAPMAVVAAVEMPPPAREALRQLAVRLDQLDADLAALRAAAPAAETVAAGWLHDTIEDRTGTAIRRRCTTWPNASADRSRRSSRR